MQGHTFKSLPPRLNQAVPLATIVFKPSVAKRIHILVNASPTTQQTALGRTFQARFNKV